MADAETKYVLLTFTSNNTTLKMGCGEVIKINSLEGFFSPPYITHTQSNATEDGTTETGSKIDERTIKVKFTIDNLINPEVIREKIQSFFNPKFDMKLVCTYVYQKRWISGRVIKCEPVDPEASMFDYQQFVLEMLCTNPFWNNMDDFGKNIAANTGMIAFPLSFVTFNENHESRTASMPVGYKSLSNIVVLNNSGNVPTGFKASFKAARGPVKNIKLVNENNTNEYIEIIKDMVKDDEILINTNVGHKTITLNGKNIFKDKNKLSTLFQLQIGDNKISYDAAENYSNLDVRIYYTPQYLGV